VLNEYKVFSSIHNEECLPAGEYVFEQEYLKTEYDEDEEEKRVSWRFTLSIGE